MYKNATKCNETIGKWCKNKHGASKIIDTFETYHDLSFNNINRWYPTKLSIKVHASRAGVPRKLPPARVSRTYLYELVIPT
jgi:hypothetical protein